MTIETKSNKNSEFVTNVEKSELTDNENVREKVELENEAIQRTRKESDILESLKNRDFHSARSNVEKLLESKRPIREDYEHPLTKVPIKWKKVELPDGSEIENYYPEFPQKFERILPPELRRTWPSELRTATEHQQVKYMNEQLRNAVENDIKLKSLFNEKQLKQIANGDRPDGYTWHHHEDNGKMQLVETVIHQKTPHEGGRKNWCGTDHTSKIENGEKNEK